MKISKLMRKISGFCFLLAWIPFVIAIYQKDQLIAASASDQLTDVPMNVAIWVVLFVILMGSSVILTIGSMFTGAFANRRMISKGLDAEAKILSTTDTGSRINNDPVVEFSLLVKPDGQPDFVGDASQTVSILHLPLFQPGKMVVVKYLPGNEHVTIVGAKID